MARISVSQMLNALVDVGRNYLDRSGGGSQLDVLVAQCNDLVSVHGEASGTALASRIVNGYLELSEDEQVNFLLSLNEIFAPDREVLVEATRAYMAYPENNSYRKLLKVVEAPWQELFRRINMAPGGTSTIVGMRQLVRSQLIDHPELENLQRDLKYLLSSWFNRGFLQFEQINWRTPAIILEKLIAYEAVHEIHGWEDLRRRLADDRRCFSFFHPALPDEPLIFVEVALTRGLIGQIQTLILKESETGIKEKPDTAIFYSISNCQAGLEGISFGNFLIKQVVDTIKSELHDIKQFATLSPIPGFCKWLDDSLEQRQPEFLSEKEFDLLQSEWRDNELMRQPLKSLLMRLCARYLIEAKHKGHALDPVAKFHLGNGAGVEQINWAADLSRKGIEQSLGMMVNYVYDSEKIISNHETYVRDGFVSASKEVLRLAKGKDGG